MAAYCWVYDSRHLQADCQEPGSATEPYDRQSSVGYLYLWWLDAQSAGANHVLACTTEKYSPILKFLYIYLFYMSTASSIIVTSTSRLQVATTSLVDRRPVFRAYSAAVGMLNIYGIVFAHSSCVYGDEKVADGPRDALC